MMTKEELEELLVNQNLPYAEIGRRFGVTGATIKKRARKHGIILNRISYTGHNKIRTNRICCVCTKKLNKGTRYCSRVCQQLFNREMRLRSWLNEDIYSKYVVRDFLSSKQKGCCNRCKLSIWNEVPIPLELEHKDGNSDNNKRENLELLCPNCHAQTPTYKSKNKGNGRWKRRQRYQEGKSF